MTTYNTINVPQSRQNCKYPQLILIPKVGSVNDLDLEIGQNPPIKNRWRGMKLHDLHVASFLIYFIYFDLFDAVSHVPVQPRHFLLDRDLILLLAGWEPTVISDYISKGRVLLCTWREFASRRVRSKQLKCGKTIWVCLKMGERLYSKGVSAIFQVWHPFWHPFWHHFLALSGVGKKILRILKTWNQVSLWALGFEKSSSVLSLMILRK